MLTRILLLLLFSTFHANVFAGLVEFDSETAFLAATGPLAFFEDFEEAELSGAPGVIIGNAVDQTTNNAVFSTGDIPPGLVITTSDGNPLAVLGPTAVIGGGGFSHSSQAIFPNLFTDSLVLNLTNTNAVGFRAFSQYTSTSPQTPPNPSPNDKFIITVFDDSNNEMAFEKTIDFFSGIYFGVLLDDDDSFITKITIASTNESIGGEFGAEIIDNISFGLIPEPTSLNLLSLGILSIFIRRYKKN